MTHSFNRLLPKIAPLSRMLPALATAAGLVVAIPAAVSAEELLSESDSGKIVRIQPGDSLSKLAKKYLGDPMKWHALMRHNNIKDPNVIDPGMEIEIPLSLKNTKSNPAEVVYATPMEIYYDYQREGRHLEDGDFIPPAGQVSANDGTALLKLPDQSKFHLEKEAIIQMNGFYESKADNGNSIFRTFLKSIEGRVKFEVSKVLGDGQFEVETPKGIIKVKGTMFAIEIKEDADIAVETYEGAVALQLEGSDEEVPIAAGEGVVIPKEATSLAEVTKVKLLTAPVISKEPEQSGRTTIFEWDPVEGAVEYIVYAGGDEEFSEPIKLGIARGQNNIEVERLPRGEYHWNVIAVDENGLRSPADDPQPFEIR